MTHLGEQLSPYLQAHADNPIDWYPWGREAFEEAARRDVPVLISIGYHTCHWCHVMARESFQDEHIAQRVNQSLVAIKVDREEHPDVDAHYLTQAGAFLEQLGWPLTIFATPQGDAFHAATYLPPTPRGDIPSFGQTIDAVTQAWRQTRDQVDQGAQRLREAIRAADAQAKQRDAFDLDDSVWEGVIGHLLEQEDTQWGGLGGAPKFPIAPILSFLIGTNRPDATALATRSLAAIAGSSVRDSVDGGFFRYATKPDWSEPHYERMLSDNAQLLWLYSAISDLDTAAGIVNWLRTVMRLPIGFGSAQDSESDVDGERVEGGYYRVDPARRQGLVPPAIDDKVLAGWNGLAIAGLARAARHGVAGDPRELARDVADELWDTHWSEDGGLARMSRDGSLSPAHATLEDYGGLAVGFIELGLVTGDPEWCRRAKQLVDACIGPEGVFGAPGGVDPTVASFEAISGDVTEGAMPSGLALVSHASLSLHQLTGEDSYYRVAQTSVTPYAEAVSVRPLGFGGLAGVLWQTHRGLRELVVVGPADNSVAKWAKDHLPPSWLLLCVTPDQARSWSQAGFGLLDSRDAGEGVVAYVCRGGVCDLPRHTIAEVEKAIQFDLDA